MIETIINEPLALPSNASPITFDETDIRTRCASCSCNGWLDYSNKEDKEMYGEYGNYGRRAGYDAYGRGDYRGYNNYGRDEYGRRGYDMKYRGDEELDRMAGEYGRYMESRNRYGAGEETDKSFHYMVKALEDFIMVLKEEAETPQQKQQLMQSLQNSMR